MAPPGEALRMAGWLGPAGGTPQRGGRCPREASARHSGAGQAGSPCPAGQGHGLGFSGDRESEGGLASEGDRRGPSGTVGRWGWGRGRATGRPEAQLQDGGRG